jgi:predicted lipoprotein with Yx(FWY)xxD motif
MIRRRRRRVARRGWRKAPIALGAMGVLAVVLSACSQGTTVTTFGAPPTTTQGVTLATESSPAGPILATGTGFTLYDFAPDTPDHSACVNDICVSIWPPLVVQGRPTVGKGLRPGLVGTIRRADGATQVTYGGHPLYTWNGDTKPGMVTGQALLNAGGYWYVVAPSGKQITSPFAITK